MYKLQGAYDDYDAPYPEAYAAEESLGRSGRGKERLFSLYCLDVDEMYFGSATVRYYVPRLEAVVDRRAKAVRAEERVRKKPCAIADLADARGLARQEGRLHAGSRSVLFEPHDPSEPIVVLPFDTLHGKGADVAIDSGQRALTTGIMFSSVYAFRATQHGQYTSRQPVRVAGERPPEHVFEFAFNGGRFLEKVNSLYVAWRDGGGIPRSVSPKGFDLSCLMVSERVVLEMGAVELVEPLLRLPVLAVLTDRMLYLQSLHDTSAVSVHKVRLETLQKCVKKKLDSLDTTVELHVVDEDSGVALKVLRCRSESVRNTLYRAVCTHPAVRLPAHNICTLKRVMDAWVHGEVSTYEYLMYLNWASGRSMKDISAYPVFPWVLSDYTSRTIDLADPSVYRDLRLPMGAIDADRLAWFRARMHESQEPFLYSTHYSCPGYVTYFLVREHPEWMLHRNNGEFDPPDEIFDSVSGCWASAASQRHDVKELIPQFYAGDGAFLNAARALQLGTKTTGEKVRPAVRLPPWARSVGHFIAMNRDALEGEVCSGAIHAWIDLIFGHKSRGEQAFQAHNLFHPHTYEAETGRVRDDDEAVDVLAEEGRQAQARQVGQCPLQLFSTPHPRRKVRATPKPMYDTTFWDVLESLSHAQAILTPPQVATPKAHAQGKGGLSGMALLLHEIERSPDRSNPLLSVFTLTYDLLDGRVPPYIAPCHDCAMEEDAASTANMHVVAQSRRELLLSITDVEGFADILYHFFLNQNNIMLDDMVWFVPQAGEAFVRRTNQDASLYPAKHSPAVAWAESLILNIVVQWEYELVVAVVHEPPRRDHTLHAADWFTHRVYPSPTAHEAVQDDDGIDTYSVTYPDLYFATTEATKKSRVPPGAHLWVVELNAVLRDRRVPVKRIIVGHVDLARRFEACGRKSERLVCNGAVHAKVELEPTFLGFNLRKPNDTAMLCTLDFIQADRLDILAAIKACVDCDEEAARPLLHLPSEHCRSTEQPPKTLPEMVDTESHGEPEGDQLPLDWDRTDLVVPLP